MKIATLEEKLGRTRLSSSLRLNWSLNVECFLEGEMSNTFKLQFNLKLELKRGNEESNPGGEMSNTFKLQFKVKLELKRGNGSLEENSGRTRLSSSLRLNWSLNVEMLLGAILILAFNFQFKVKLEVKRQFQHSSAFMILAFKLQFKVKLA
ncbi:uncharacterized protein DS421_3g87370 [Arachis hypogaea]|nr:uncharacterized protein DS421_3g87360 [Arachis hypogaea]QHO58039.1 uncharacterized protein DS421_3g87370 [Arachis hypogaea]